MIAECIVERRRTQGMRVVVEVWHAVAGPVEADRDDASWRPIKCGSGIVFPGNARMCEPTCAECIAALPSPSNDQPKEDR